MRRPETARKGSGLINSLAWNFAGGRYVRASRSRRCLYLCVRSTAGDSPFDVGADFANAGWWGYELSLPPPVLRTLASYHSVSTTMFTFFQAFIVAVSSLPPPPPLFFWLHTAGLSTDPSLQGGAPELAPFVSVSLLLPFTKSLLTRSLHHNTVSISPATSTLSIPRSSRQTRARASSSPPPGSSPSPSFLAPGTSPSPPLPPPHQYHLPRFKPSPSRPTRRRSRLLRTRWR